MSTYLSRKQIVSTQGISTAEVECPEWGGKVLVRELTAIEATDIGLTAVAGGASISRKTLGKGKTRDTVPTSGLVDMFPRIVAMCVVDEDLNPILSEDDVRSLSARSVAPIQRIADKAFDLSELSDKDEDEDDEEGQSDPN